MERQNVVSGPQLPHTMASVLRPHQISAIQFLWEKLVSKGILTIKKSIADMDFYHSQLFGAVVGHSMGLGKTLTAITFLVLLQKFISENLDERVKNPPDIKVCPRLRVLVIAPRSCVEHWRDSCETWMTSSYLSDIEPLPVYIPTASNEGLVSTAARFYNEGGILMVGYEEYLRAVRNAQEDLKPLSCVSTKSLLTAGGFRRAYRLGPSLKGSQEARKFAAEGKVCLLEMLENVDVVVFDEAHRMKHAQSNTVQYLSYHLRNVKLRIALTGTPLQNHLDEYNVMLSVVRGALVDKRQFSKMFTKPIEEGQCADSSYHQFLEMQKCVATLRKYFSDYVHHCGTEILRNYIPRRSEFVLFFQLSPEQDAVYRRALQECLQRMEGSGNSDENNKNQKGAALLFHHTASHICLHPSLERLKDSQHEINANEAYALDNDDVDENGIENSADTADAGPAAVIVNAEDIMRSPKLHFAISLIRHIIGNLGEKVVVFSHYLAHLHLVGHLLDSFYGISSATFSGSVPVKERSRITQEFRTSSTLNVLLCSVLAGGVGINLSVANHCILMDVDWNPTNDTQATYRIYRLGQTREVFIYRLACLWTTEHVVFSYALQKSWLHRKIADVHDPARQQQHQKDNYFRYPSKLPVPGAKEYNNEEERKEKILKLCEAKSFPIVRVLQEERGLLDALSYCVPHSFLLEENEDEMIKEVGKKFELKRQKSLLHIEDGSDGGKAVVVSVIDPKSNHDEAGIHKNCEGRLERLVEVAARHISDELEPQSRSTDKLELFQVLDKALGANSSFFPDSNRPRSNNFYSYSLKTVFLKAYVRYASKFFDEVISSTAFASIKANLASAAQHLVKGRKGQLSAALMYMPIRLMDYVAREEQTYIATELGCTRPLIIHLLVEGVKDMFNTLTDNEENMAHIRKFNQLFESTGGGVAKSDDETFVKMVERSQQNLVVCFDLLWPRYGGFWFPTIPFNVDQERRLTEQCFLRALQTNVGLIRLEEAVEEFKLKSYNRGQTIICKRCSDVELRRLNSNTFSCSKCHYNLEFDVRKGTRFLHRSTLYRLSVVCNLLHIRLESTFTCPKFRSNSHYDLLRSLAYFSQEKGEVEEAFPLVLTAFDHGVNVLLSEFPESTVQILAIQSGTGYDIGRLHALFLANSYVVWATLLKPHLKKKITENFRAKVPQSSSLAQFTGMPLMLIVLGLIYQMEETQLYQSADAFSHPEVSPLFYRITEFQIKMIYLKKLLDYMNASTDEESTLQPPKSPLSNRQRSLSSTLSLDLSPSPSDSSSGADITAPIGREKNEETSHHHGGSRRLKRPRSITSRSDDVDSDDYSSSRSSSYRIHYSSNELLSDRSSSKSISLQSRSAESTEQTDDADKNPMDDLERKKLYWLAFIEVYGTKTVSESENVKQQFHQSGMSLENLSHYSRTKNGKTLLECLEMFVESVVELSQHVQLLRQ